MRVKEVYNIDEIKLAPPKYKVLYMVFYGVPFVVLLLLIGGGVLGAMVAAGLGFVIGVPLFKLFVKIPKKKVAVKKSLSS